MNKISSFNPISSTGISSENPDPGNIEIIAYGYYPLPDYKKLQDCEAMYLPNASFRANKNLFQKK